MPDTSARLGLSLPLSNETFTRESYRQNLLEIDESVETPAGAQAKADAAEDAAKSYADQQVDELAGVGNTKTVKALDDEVAAHLADYVAQPANGGTTGGTSTAYTCSSDPAPDSLIDKIGVVITAHTDSEANPTLNWNSLGAKTIKKPNGNAATLKAGGIYTLRYNATSQNFILQGEGGSDLSGDAGVGDVLSGKTFYNNDPETKETGTMPNRGAYNITPGATAVTIPEGYHNGEGTVAAVSGLTAGDTLVLTVGSAKYLTNTSYTKAKEARVEVGVINSIRVSFQLRSNIGGEYKAWGRIYKNGQPIGIERETNSDMYITYTEDFSDIHKDDLIQLYVKTTSGGWVWVYAFNILVSPIVVTTVS